jgi:hypothetical protein
MSIFDASALNDNDLAFLAHSNGRSFRTGAPAAGSMRPHASPAAVRRAHAAACVPLIIGVPVSITFASE